MGSIFQDDFRLSEFSRLTEILAEEFVQVIIDGFNNDILALGSNSTDKIYKKEAFFTISDNGFDNVVLSFKKKNVEFGNPYEIVVESRDSDSTSELFIQPDEILIDKLPDELLQELDAKLDEILGF